MSRPTLIDIVQNILSEMNSDSVNSISDTVESLQVANIVKNIFNEIVDEHNLLTVRTRVRLTASGSSSRPTHMTIDEAHAGISSVYYDTRAEAADPLNYTVIEQVLPEEFIRRTMSRDSTDTDNVSTITDGTNTPLLILKTSQPSFFTSFDDQTLVFDAYDSVLESTLQASKSLVYAKARPQFSLSDTYEPDLPENLVSLLLSEAKSHCFYSLKQMPNEKVEQSARRLRINAQDYKNRIDTHDRWAKLPYPDFGRKPR